MRKLMIWPKYDLSKRLKYYDTRTRHNRTFVFFFYINILRTHQQEHRNYTE